MNGFSHLGAEISNDQNKFGNTSLNLSNNTNAHLTVKYKPDFVPHSEDFTVVGSIG